VNVFKIDYVPSNLQNKSPWILAVPYSYPKHIMAATHRDAYLIRPQLAPANCYVYFWAKIIKNESARTYFNSSHWNKRNRALIVIFKFEEYCRLRFLYFEDFIFIYLFNDSYLSVNNINQKLRTTVMSSFKYFCTFITLLSLQSLNSLSSLHYHFVPLWECLSAIVRRHRQNRKYFWEQKDYGVMVLSRTKDRIDCVKPFSIM
jgi:hypothetical protein